MSRTRAGRLPRETPWGRPPARWPGRTGRTGRPGPSRGTCSCPRARMSSRSRAGCPLMVRRRRPRRSARWRGGPRRRPRREPGGEARRRSWRGSSSCSLCYRARPGPGWQPCVSSRTPLGGCWLPERADKTQPRGGADARQPVLYHPAAAHRHIRHGGLDALAGVSGGNGRSGNGRECLRRGGRGRVRAPGGRAAHVRAGRRGTRDRLRRGGGGVLRAQRPGQRPGLGLIPGNGLLPACVPAAFGTWLLLLHRHGTLRLREVLQYAVGYAAAGYPLLPSASAAIASVAGIFRDHWPTSAEIYLRPEPPAAGSRFGNKVLAATYERILSEAEAAGASREAQLEAARRCWYEGFVAEAIDAYLTRAEVMDASGQAHRGLLTGADMA